MFTIKGQVREIFAAKGKGPRKVRILSEDGRDVSVRVDTFDHDRKFEVGKSVELPVQVSVNEYKGKSYLNIVNWPAKDNGKGVK